MNQKIKYPRTFHLPSSEILTSDDKKHTSDYFLKDKEVVVSIKKDGENTTIYNDTSHARSLDSDKDTEDRRWIELFRQLKIFGKIPNSYRLCGENLFYKHTVKYDNLKSYFELFSIWDNEICLSWDDTIQFCNNLLIETVPIIYRGVYDRDKIMKYFLEYKKEIESEGFVIRLADSFLLKDFEKSIGKFVSKEFVIPDQHWKYSAKTRNGIIYDDYWDIK